MARLFEKYDEKNPPIQCFMPDSKWFRQSGTFQPKGLLWHDTGADNPWLKRYVQPADNDPHHDELIQLIGKNTYGNDWEHGGKDKDAGLNCWVGKVNNSKVTTLQAGPWNKRPWGCGSQKRNGGNGGNGVTYSLNDTHIQWEICEDAKHDKEYFGDCYEESIQLSAYLCKMWSIDPHACITYKGIKVPTIVCHWDSYNLGCGSGHGDIYDWDAMYDYLGIAKSKVKTNDPYNNLIMERIRDDIAKAMQDGPVKDGWVKENGKWYYYDANGKMVVDDWIKYKGSWYFLGKDGAMVTGWQTFADKKYFFHSDGRMASDEWIRENGIYKFLDMDGVQRYKADGSWQDNGIGEWWADTFGMYPKSRTIMIDGKSYEFDEKGYLI